MTRRNVVVALLAFVLALPVMAIAQTPNFSGKWIQDMEKSDPAMGGRGPAGPQSLTITQTAAEITLERETPNGVVKTVYKLDGSASVNAMGRGGEVTSKSAWEGGKLVTKYPHDGRDDGRSHGDAQPRGRRDPDRGDRDQGRAAGRHDPQGGLQEGLAKRLQLRIEGRDRPLQHLLLGGRGGPRKIGRCPSREPDSASDDAGAWRAPPRTAAVLSFPAGSGGLLLLRFDGLAVKTTGHLDTHASGIRDSGFGPRTSEPSPAASDGGRG